MNVLLKSKKIQDLIKIAQINKNHKDFFQAKINLRKAENLDPYNYIVLNNLANVYKETNEVEKSIKYYLKALCSNPKYNVAKINLAILYHELGKLNQAENLYKEIINNDPLNFGVCFNLSNINFEFFNNKNIKFIEDTLINKNLSNFEKASGYFILAKNQKLKKNIDQELNFLNKAHKYCYQKNNNMVEKSLFYWLNFLPKKYNKIEYKNKKPLSKLLNKMNPIFVVGLPRSGSTLIESVISSGLVKIPNGGETAIINTAILKNLKTKTLSINLNDFSNYVLTNYEHLNLIQKNKNYFFVDKSLENFFYIESILKIFPNAKFINCERNAFNSVFAIYTNFFAKMYWSHSLENIIQYIDQYLKIIDYFKKKYSQSIYTVELKNFTENSLEISKELFSFCKLDWHKSSLEFYKRHDLISKTASNVQIRNKIFKYNVDKYKDYKKFIEKFENKYSWLKK